METLAQCPVCESTQFVPFMTPTDYLVSGEKFTIQECQSCGFRFTNPRPGPDSIGSYYKSDQYVSHNDSGGGVINTAYRIVRNYTLQSKLDLINKLNNGSGRLLDVGCGTGAFLERCQQTGWQITGVEPDEDARTVATQKLRIAIESNLQGFDTNSPFDIITLWHVLEHVSDLKTTVQQLSRLLSKQGTLLVAVPNSDSYDARYYKQFWAAYDVPRHLYHFTPDTIEPLFAQYGLRLNNKLPMKFDAFYIGMLSTRYRTGKTSYVESVRTGITSNIQATRTGQSSSIVYLFQKA